MTVNPRIYRNLRIYKAKGYSQGADSVYIKFTPAQRDKVVKDYLSLAKSLLTEKDDKLLIIGHKEHIQLLEKKNKSKKIVFTNWGNHVGKNMWSDCNKVMVIGWFILPETEYYGNFINSVGGLDAANKVMDTTTKSTYKETQLADDLIQGMMRGSARITVSKDGDCKESEVYLFYPNNKEGNKVMKLVEDQFLGATVMNWYPELTSTPKKVPKSVQNLEKVFQCLEEEFKVKEQITLSELVEKTQISKPVISKLTNTKEFQDQLKSNDYTLVQGSGKTPTSIYKKDP